MCPPPLPPRLLRPHIKPTLDPGVTWPQPGTEVFLRDSEGILTSPVLLMEKMFLSVDLAQERVLSSSFYIHTLCGITPKI